MSKVLMLGWEFPPLYSGGLGVATYGIVKAMSQRAEIRLIIPTAATGEGMGNVAIKGLNKVTSDEVDLERLTHNLGLLASEVITIPMALSPYHHINDDLAQSESEAYELLRMGKATLSDVHSIFSSQDVYGSNILQKIYLYAQLAAQLASDKDFDVIHAHDWITFPGGVKIKENSGKPLVLHVHSLETDRSGESCRNKIFNLEKNAFAVADKIIAVSQYTKEQLSRHYDIDPERVTVVHNGIDPVPTSRKEHSLRDKLVVFLGRLTHQKGPDFLIETAEKVVSVYPRVKFVVAGTGDQFAHALETSAYKKLGSKFIFTGFLSKVRVNELLSMADVYFMPSVSEPFGLTALEAAQFGVPCVISRQSGAAEVMQHTLQADFWDTDKYANYIYALLKYGALKSELTLKTQREIAGLTWEHAADEVFKIYHQVRNN